VSGFEVRSSERRLTSPHQRCDGKLPCTTCVDGERSAGCTYEPRQRSRRADSKALSVSRDSVPCPLSIRMLPSKPPGVGFLFSRRPTHPSLDIPLTLSNPSESCSPPAPCERPLTLPPNLHDEVVPDPPSGVLVVRNVHDTSECIPHPTVPSFTVLPSIHLRTISRCLQVPLLPIPPERIQISPITRSDMTLYVPVQFPNFRHVMGIEP